MGLSLILRGAFTEAPFELDGSRAVRIGRSGRCDLVVADPTVSRFHAELLLKSERVVLSDLESTNGTFVNDVRAVSEVVGPGDRIRLGSAELVLFLQGTGLPRPNRLDSAAGRDGKTLTGVADHLSPVDLVQVLAGHGKTGTLMLHKGRFGRIDFREGRVCFAQADGLQGEKAFHRLLGWVGAEFQFCNGHPRETNLELATERLLVDTVRHQEEMEMLRKRLPDPQTELCPQPTTAPVQLSSLEWDVIRAAPSAQTLAGLMDVSSHSDVEVARAVAKLIELGILFPKS